MTATLPLARTVNDSLAAAYADLVARYPGIADVILVEPNGHGIGWPSFECAFAAHVSTWRGQFTLTDFARQHFGHGVLRKIGANRYAVIVTARPALPVILWGDEFDRPLAA